LSAESTSSSIPVFCMNGPPATGMIYYKYVKLIDLSTEGCLVFLYDPIQGFRFIVT
jgi:hypothetical protein